MQPSKIIYFIAGSSPTNDEMSAINSILAGQSYLTIRTNLKKATYGETPEFADYVAGTIPETHSNIPIWSNEANMSQVSKLLIGGNSAVVIGDSLATQDKRLTSGGYYTQSGNGVFSQINARMRQFFKLKNVGGYSGRTLGTVISFFDVDVAPFMPDYLFVIGSIENDIFAGTPAATIVSNVNTLIDRCQSLGIRLVIMGTPPGGTQLTTNARSQAYIDLNRTLANTMRSKKNVLFLRADYQYYDVANLVKPSPLSGGFSDGAWHPYARGACILADSFTKDIAEFVGISYDPFDTAWFTGATGISALVGNPFNQGSQVASGGLTGFVPGAGVTFSKTGTGSGVASVVARTDKPGNWCKVAYSGPTTNPVWQTDFLRGETPTVSLATAGLAVGDFVTGLWEVCTDGNVAGLMGANVFIIFGNSTGVGRVYGNYQNSGAVPNTPMLSTPITPQVLATPKIAIPPGTTTLRLCCDVHPSGANAVFNAMFGMHGYNQLSSDSY